MQVTTAGPSIVKSVRQRQLLNAWLRLAARCGTLPDVASYDVDRLEEEKPDMMFYDVTYENNAPRYMVTYDGQRLIDAVAARCERSHADAPLGCKSTIVRAPPAGRDNRLIFSDGSTLRGFHPRAWSRGK